MCSASLISSVERFFGPSPKRKPAPPLPSSIATEGPRITEPLALEGPSVEGPLSLEGSPAKAPTTRKKRKGPGGFANLLGGGGAGPNSLLN